MECLLRRSGPWDPMNSDDEYDEYTVADEMDWDVKDQNKIVLRFLMISNQKHWE